MRRFTPRQTHEQWLLATVVSLSHLPGTHAKAFFGLAECTTDYYLEPIVFVTLGLIVVAIGHGVHGKIYSKIRQCDPSTTGRAHGPIAPPPSARPHCHLPFS